MRVCACVCAFVQSLSEFLQDKLKYLGTSACPPYHLAIVIGGLSAEQTLKTAKLASVKYLDNLPTKGNAHGQAFRDVEWEQKVLKMSQEMGIGAQCQTHRQRETGGGKDTGVKR
jgi:fumarate hydratase class I